MATVNPDLWAQFHMRWLALSRWDNEGGASPSRHTQSEADTATPEDARLAPSLEPKPPADH